MFPFLYIHLWSTDLSSFQEYKRPTLSPKKKKTQNPQNTNQQTKTAKQANKKHITILKDMY